MGTLRPPLRPRDVRRSLSFTSTLQVSTTEPCAMQPCLPSTDIAIIESAYRRMVSSMPLHAKAHAHLMAFHDSWRVVDQEDFRRAVTLLLGPLLQAALKNLFARWYCDTTFRTCLRLVVLKPTAAALRVRQTLLRKAGRQEPVCQTFGRPLRVLRDVALGSLFHQGLKR